MKEISIEASASRTTELKALSSVISYAKSHITDICNGIEVITLAYAILAVEADNYSSAIIAVAISGAALLVERKGGKK